MQSFLVAVLKGDDCVVADQFVTAAAYLEILLKASLIICESGNPDDYQIAVITNFGSKDPLRSKGRTFHPSDIRDFAGAAKFAGVEYEI